MTLQPYRKWRTAQNQSDSFWLQWWIPLCISTIRSQIGNTVESSPDWISHLFFPLLPKSRHCVGLRAKYTEISAHHNYHDFSSEKSWKEKKRVEGKILCPTFQPQINVTTSPGVHLCGRVFLDSNVSLKRIYFSFKFFYFIFFRSTEK